MAKVKRTKNATALDTERIWKKGGISQFKGRKKGKMVMSFMSETEIKLKESKEHKDSSVKGGEKMVETSKKGMRREGRRECGSRL